MKPKESIDKPLLITILTMVVFGLIMIASAGSVKSFQLTDGVTQYLFFNRQLLFVMIGLIALYILQRTNYHKLKIIAFPFMIIAIISLILVFVPGLGLTINGARRWIGIAGITIQASEIAKLAFIIYLAAWLDKRGKEVKNMSMGLIPFVVMIATISILIILEPDVGTLGVITMTAIAMYYVGGARWRDIGILFASGFAALATLIKLAPYRLNRFKVFLNPELDPKGIGYQINQALLAIGSGGVLGLGLGHSRQKYNYLPEPINDSIFAIIGEELGMIGAIFVVILFLYFAYRGFKIAKHAPDRFGKLIATGITFWLTVQAFVNIGGIIAIIPLTGIPLPFISFGRAALVISLAAIGVLLNISKYSTHNTSPVQNRADRTRTYK